MTYRVAYHSKFRKRPSYSQETDGSWGWIPLTSSKKKAKTYPDLTSAQEAAKTLPLGGSDEWTAKIEEV